MREIAPGELPLPRGRHHLTRDQVTATQRRRIFSAMAEVTARKGYAHSTVADVIALAGVSRETFYQQFASKAACFEQAFDASAAVLFGDLQAMLAPIATSTPLERFERALAGYLDAVATHPAMARLCLVEVFAVGRSAVERRAGVQDRFANGIVIMLGLSGDRGQFAAKALVGAVDSMVTQALALEQVDGIRALQVPLVELVRTALAL